MIHVPKSLVDFARECVRLHPLARDEFAVIPSPVVVRMGDLRQFVGSADEHARQTHGTILTLTLEDVPMMGEGLYHHHDDEGEHDA